jgi:hypothetical protein
MMTTVGCNESSRTGLAPVAASVPGLLAVTLFPAIVRPGPDSVLQQANKSMIQVLLGKW